MREIQSDVFSQIDGKLNGNFILEGKKDKIRSLKADLDIPKGGTLKASLLSFIMAYLPQSTQKKELEALMGSEGHIPFEKGFLLVRSLNDETLAAEIGLKSEKFNLDIDVTVDINLEGGLQNLLGYLKDFSK